MRLSFLRTSPALGVALVSLCTAAACGSNSGEKTSSGSSAFGGSSSSSGSATGGAPAGTGGSFTISVGTGGTSSALVVTPASPLETVTVPLGAVSPTVTFEATVNQALVNAVWSVDKGNIATIAPGPGGTETLMASGTTGGTVTVTVAYMNQTEQRQVLVKLAGTQNGPNASTAEGMQTVPDTDAGVAQLSAGGGVGGVGGEGLGPGVTDPNTLMALANPQNTAQAGSLSLLYPYNGTVWPRGMIAPLLMWSWAQGDADAIKIDLSTTTGSFTWSGTFGRPAILAQTGGKYIRSPIPQDVWAAATNTASGKTDQLTVALTVALNGQAYGPFQETWTIAPALLTGTVYYNSYGTHFVKNWTSLDGANNPVGAAILGVRSSDLAPTLIAGQDSPLDGNGNPTDDSGCRVCHTVATKGRWLTTASEQGSPGDGLNFLYDLSSASVPTSGVALATQGTFTWGAMTGDGSYMLTNMVNPSSTNPAISATASTLWNFIPIQPPVAMPPTVMPVNASLVGLPSGVAAGYPSFSPDGTMITYVDATSNLNTLDGPLIAAAYDATTQAFSNVTTLVPAPTNQRVGYPVFLPDNSGVLYEREVRASCTDTVMVTRNGARGQIEWVNTGASPTPTPLANLNGAGYLPTGPDNHGSGLTSDPQATCVTETGLDDTTLSYEPTVLPVVAGGYAWVVFTSRRLYGNQLTATPWLSWPPDYDTHDLSVATVKKLWVAAIDLGAPAGTDPSHPAFYLPAQEILAGNSRGFWVLDPCKADGSSCESGDQCCNGYCEPNGPMQSLTCSNTQPTSMCSGVQEKCTTSTDCCDSTNRCVAGFCALPTPT